MANRPLYKVLVVICKGLYTACARNCRNAARASSPLTNQPSEREHALNLLIPHPAKSAVGHKQSFGGPALATLPPLPDLYGPERSSVR